MSPHFKVGDEVYVDDENRTDRIKSIASTNANEKSETMYFLETSTGEAYPESDLSIPGSTKRGFSMTHTFTKEVIVDQWAELVEGAGSKVEQVFKDTEENIKKSEAPDIEFERVKVSPSFWGGIFGNERTFLLVRDTHLRGFDIYIGVREYGKHLDLIWYLIHEPGFLWRLMNKLLLFFKKKLVLNLDVFDEHDLRVYATVVHHCFLSAVEKINKESGSSQVIKRNTTGFLGIS